MELHDTARKHPFDIAPSFEKLPHFYWMLEKPEE